MFSGRSTLDVIAMSVSPPFPPASVEEVLACLARHVMPLPEEQVPLNEAGGRILRETVRASEDQPPFDVAAMDGYAIREEERGEVLKVVGMCRAGDWLQQTLEPGQAMQIATGAALPSPGLRVIPREDVERQGDQVRVLRRARDKFIRWRGQNLRAGDEVLGPGVRLTHGRLALLATVGCARPVVTRRPRVFHLVTGDELVPPDQSPAFAQIRDSNSTLVAAFLREWGIPVEAAKVGEDEEEARAVLAARLTASVPPEVLIISGGVSVGEHDYVRRLLEHFGFQMLIHRTAARPGRPLVVAQRPGTLAFGLPGNPLAHFVCLNLYVRAALGKLLGLAAPLVFWRGRLAAAYAHSDSAWETLCPAQWQGEGGGQQITLLPWQNSGDLTPLRQANAVARLPGGRASLSAGTEVFFLPLLEP